MRSITIALAIALSPIALSAQQKHGTDVATISKAVDSLAARAVADGLASALGVGIAMDGKVVFDKSYGMADATRKIPADKKTLWYVASTSKSFTGFGTALLAQRGVIKLDAPITTLLPGVKWPADARADSLTLLQFLSHTHGLNDNAVVQSAAFTGSIPEAKWPELIVLAQKRQGSDLIYSNFGYNVAAMVIDRVRPEGWRKFLETNVYAPAGLRETYTRVSGIDEKRIAKPHSLESDGRYVAEPFQKNDVTMNSAGGHIATINDLARWTIVQMDSGMIDGKRVFPKEAIVRSHTLIAKQTRDQSKRFAFFDREGWGAGWDLGTYEGERMVSRFGSYGPTRSHLSFLPARRTGVVVMQSGGPSVVTDIIAAYAYDLEAGKPDAREKTEKRYGDLLKGLPNGLKSIAREDSVRASRQQQPLRHPLADFVGNYDNASYGRLTFTMGSDGKLQYRWGALFGPAEIYDASKDQIRVEFVGSGSVLNFTFGASGPATKVTLGDVAFTRVPR